MKNEKNIKIFYVAEFSLPNMSAYSLHVLKMCDALSELGYDLTLILNSCNERYNFSKIKIDVSLFLDISQYFAYKPIINSLKYDFEPSKQ